MKLQIDFDKKKIKLLEEVNLGKLVEILKGLFPDKWKELKIEQTVEFVNWINPIVIREVRPWWEVQPYWTTGTPTILCETGTISDTNSNITSTITYNDNNAISTSIAYNGVCNVDIQC